MKCVIVVRDVVEVFQNVRMQESPKEANIMSAIVSQLGDVFFFRSTAMRNVGIS